MFFVVPANYKTTLSTTIGRTFCEEPMTHISDLPDSLNDKPGEYNMKVVSLVVRPAATIPGLALRKTAEHASEYYNKNLLIRKKTSMNDIIDTVECLENAKTRTWNLEILFCYH